MSNRPSVYAPTYVYNCDRIPSKSHVQLSIFSDSLYDYGAFSLQNRVGKWDGYGLEEPEIRKLDKVGPHRTSRRGRNECLKKKELWLWVIHAAEQEFLAH